MNSGHSPQPITSFAMLNVKTTTSLRKAWLTINKHEAVRDVTHNFYVKNLHAEMFIKTLEVLLPMLVDCTYAILVFNTASKN